MAKIDFLAPKVIAVSDTECYKDYWSIGFRNPGNGKMAVFEQYEGHPLDRQAVAQLLRKYRVVGFNWYKYDLPMITLALSGASNALLKQASDDIIMSNLMPWEFEAKYGVTIRQDLDWIDLFDASPGVKISLKKYGARMGTKLLQELPFDPTASISPDMRTTMRWYLGNDLVLTQELWETLAEEQQLRASMSDQYGIDLRSKSDAQIAEALFKIEYERITGSKLYKNKDIKAESFQFQTPATVSFESDYMRGVLAHVESTTFRINLAGNVDAGDMQKYEIEIAGKRYTMGIGGLHSQEEKTYGVSDDQYEYVDSDVRGYYPALMLSCGYVPKALGKVFIPIFQGFVDVRNKAKDLAEEYGRAGDKVNQLKYEIIAGSLKIVNNGTFGQTGNPHSVLFGPRLMVQTTLTGQLSLLMLIERLTARGFEVMSANTDGIVTKIERKRRWLFDALVWDWEQETTLQMEHVPYSAIYWQSVNSYLAIPADLDTNKKAKVKTKGQFSPAGIHQKDMHDPNADICSKAVIAYLLKGTPIERTIRACADITQFVRVRMADGGGTKDGKYLGKLVRWYYGEGERGAILTAKGSRVATSMGAVPCMDLPDELPDDIDYAWYIREAYARLDDVGLAVVDPCAEVRYGYCYATQPGLKTVHILDMSKNASLCGRRQKDIREPWDEHYDYEGKVCKACEAVKVEKNIGDVLLWQTEDL
jgi:hypothetical protein